MRAKRPEMQKARPICRALHLIHARITTLPIEVMRPQRITVKNLCRKGLMMLWVVREFASLRIGITTQGLAHGIYIRD